MKEKTEIDIKNEIEAIIYLSSEVGIKDIAKFYSVKMEKVTAILQDLKKEKKESGLNLKIEKDIVYFETNPKYGGTIHNFFNRESQPKKLSRAAMETLSIIAYKQPVTKSHIEQIRGVSAEGVVHNLEEKGLIYVSGKQDGVGRPNLYSTTDNFLNYFDIESLEELPNYAGIREKNIESDIKE